MRGPSQGWIMRHRHQVRTRKGRREGARWPQRRGASGFGREQGALRTRHKMHQLSTSRRASASPPAAQMPLRAPPTPEPEPSPPVRTSHGPRPQGHTAPSPCGGRGRRGRGGTHPWTLGKQPLHAHPAPARRFQNSTSDSIKTGRSGQQRLLRLPAQPREFPGTFLIQRNYPGLPGGRSGLRTGYGHCCAVGSIPGSGMSTCGRSAAKTKKLSSNPPEMGNSSYSLTGHGRVPKPQRVVGWGGAGHRLQGQGGRGTQALPTPTTVLVTVHGRPYSGVSQKSGFCFW